MCTLVKFRRMLLPMFDSDCSKIDQFSHQILKLLNVSPRSRTEVECLMNVRFHCLRSEYRHRPCEVVHRKVQTALCPLLCMAGFRFSLFFVNANSWFGPYPIVGSNARYLYQTNLNVNAILA